MNVKGMPVLPVPYIDVHRAAEKTNTEGFGYSEPRILQRKIIFTCVLFSHVSLKYLKVSL